MTQWKNKVGQTDTRLIRLRDLGLPEPDQVVASPYQEDEVRGDLSFAGRGHKSVAWVWDIITLEQMNTLNRVFFSDSNQVNGTGYIYTTTGTAYDPNAESQYRLYEVNVKKPLLNSQDGQRVVRSSKAYSSVQYLFNVIGEETAEFSADVVSGYYPLAVTFTDNSIGTMVAWHWNFGDGYASDVETPTHTYTGVGAFHVTLTVTNADGATFSLTKEDYIAVRAPVQPVAAFSANRLTAYHQQVVTFTDQSSGDITTWLWDFGDGVTSSSQNPTHTFAGPGGPGTVAYTVSLTVSNPTQTDTETKTGYIVVREPIAPVAAFSANYIIGFNPLTVTFTDASTGDGLSAWAWDFGDGDTSTSQNPFHVYDAIGVYTVALTVTGPETTDTETKIGYITVDADMETRVKAGTYSATLLAYWTCDDALGTNPLVEEIGGWDIPVVLPVYGVNPVAGQAGLKDGSLSLYTGNGYLRYHPLGTETSIFGTGGDTWVQASGATQHADHHYNGQTFTAPASGTLMQVSLYMYCDANYTGSTTGVTVSIYAVDVSHIPTGSALSTGSTSANGVIGTNPISVTPGWVNVELTTPVSVVSGTEYAVVVHAGQSYGVDVEKAYWYKDGSAAGYAGGVSLVGGATNWTAEADDDYYLKVSILDPAGELVAAFDGDEYSIVVWTKRAGTSSAGNIIDLYGVAAQETSISIVNAPNSWAGTAEGHRAVTGQDNYLSGSVTDSSAWHCWVLTVNQATDTITMYRDGVVVGTRVNATALFAWTTSGNLKLTHVDCGLVYTYYAHISLWDGALSALDVLKLSTNQGGA